MNLEHGEIIELNNKEYILVTTLNYEGKLYGYLISNFKPVEIKFVRIIEVKKETFFEIVNEKELKLKLTEMFSIEEN